MNNELKELVERREREAAYIFYLQDASDWNAHVISNATEAKAEFERCFKKYKEIKDKKQ